MSETTTRNHWSEGVSLEGLPYEQHPKVIVKVQCFQESPLGRDYSTALPVTHHDITDWLQANPEEQLTILNQIEIELPAGSADLNDLGDPDSMDDATSGDHLVGLDEPGLPAGNAGTDIHILSAYIRYLKDCRDQGYIPFSDLGGHVHRAKNARQVAPTEVHSEMLAALDRYTTLVQSHAAVHQAFFSHAHSEQHRQLWNKTGPLVAHNHPKKRVTTT